MEKSKRIKKGVNLSIQEYQAGIIMAINRTEFPVEVRRLVVAEILSDLTKDSRIEVAREKFKLISQLNKNNEGGEPNGKA